MRRAPRVVVRGRGRSPLLERDRVDRIGQGRIASICPRGRRIVTKDHTIIDVYATECRALLAILARIGAIDVCYELKTFLIP